MPGGQLIMRPLARQYRPRAALSPAHVRPSILPLPISIMVVAPPARPVRRIDLQRLIHHLQRVHNQRIVRPPNAIPHQLQKPRIDQSRAPQTHTAPPARGSQSGSSLQGSGCYETTPPQPAAESACSGASRPACSTPVRGRRPLDPAAPQSSRHTLPESSPASSDP